jgi:uncharacterized protein (TIGR00290 family)
MHGIREELLEQQVQAIGLPLVKMYVNGDTNNEYEQKLKETLLRLKQEQNITHVAFGDIFLEDLKLYREQLLASVGLKGLFPLWKTDTAQLARQFIENGFKTITCSINDASLDESYVGVLFDNMFLNRLPQDVDPCGENGEFHTFCYAGPVFKAPVKFKLGEKVYKPLQINLHQNASELKTKGFWYVDIEGSGILDT